MTDTRTRGEAVGDAPGGVEAPVVVGQGHGARKGSRGFALDGESHLSVPTAYWKTRGGGGGSS